MATFSSLLKQLGAQFSQSETSVIEQGIAKGRSRIIQNPPSKSASSSDAAKPITADVIPESMVLDLVRAISGVPAMHRRTGRSLIEQIGRTSGFHSSSSSLSL